MVLLQWFFNAIYVVIFAKVALSFIMPIAGQRPHPTLVRINLLVNQVTEPVFAPIRRYTVFSGIDFSPFVVILVVALVRSKLGV
jgi:uncharacterized protein YggT (Ycf19 family)